MELLEKVKANLILQHNEDDALLQEYIKAAVAYVIMLSRHFYESRDGSTAGFFGDSVQAGQQVWNTVNLLLRLDRDWKV